MGRARKPKDDIEEILNLLFIFALYLGYQVWNKTQSYFLAILTLFISGLVLGGIIFLIKDFRNKRLLDSGMHEIDRMSGQKFEELLLAYFESKGYQGKLTPATEDYGADLLLEKDGRRIVVQAKRWKRTVGIEAVQQVIGAIRHYDAHKGMVITNSYLSENAYQLADSNGIELWDRQKLIEALSKGVGQKITTSVVNKSLSNKAELETAAAVEGCPRCGGSLVVRNGKNGKFMGCTNFPRCRFTQNIE